MNQKKGNSTLMARTISLLLLALAALPALAYTPPTAEALYASADSFVMRPGVIVDPARDALYVMDKEGVTAFSISRGESLWQSDAAARPIGLYGDQLIALAEPKAAGQAEIVFLNVRNGEISSKIIAALPDGAGGWVVDRPHQSFAATTTVTGGQPFFSWTFTSRPLRGAPVVAGAETNELRELGGALLLDPANRSVLPATAATQSKAQSTPWRFDLSAEERLAGAAGRQFRAGNDRHVLASEKAAADTRNRYRWTILDRADGRVLGTVDRPVSTAAFFVTGTALVHESVPFMRRLPSGEFESHGLRLVAIELSNERELWSLEIRDTVFRGIMPP